MNREVHASPLTDQAQTSNLKGRFTIPIIADLLNINICTVHQIVARDSNVRKVFVKMILKNLNDDHCRQKCLDGSRLNQISSLDHKRRRNLVFPIRP
jgi:hypothetical protein